MNSVWILIRERSKPHFRRRLWGILFSSVAAVVLAVVLNSMSGQSVEGHPVNDLSRLAPGIVTMILGVLAFCLSLLETGQWCGSSGVCDQVRSSAIQDHPLFLAMTLRIWLVMMLHFLFLSVILFTMLEIPMSFLSFLGYGLFVFVGNYAFLQLGVLVALFISSPEQKINLIFLCLLPLFFISGVFHPVYELPGFWRQLVGVLPTTALVEGAREMLIHFHMNLWYFLYLVLWAAFMHLMAYFFFQRKLNL